MTGCGGSSTTNNLPPAITSFLATPATILPGGTANLIGVFPLLSNGNVPSGVITPGNYVVDSGSVVQVSPLVTTTYTLTVSNQTGVTIAQSTTVTVGSVQQASLGVLAGLPSGVGMVNGPVASAVRFDFPCSVAVDGSGNTYVADTDNACIRLVTPAGVTSTLAGNPGHPGFADGTGASASFNGPTGVAVDKNGNLYVADTANATIRFVTPAGLVTTLAGKAGTVGRVNGPVAGATFNSPAALAVDGALNVYVADSANHAIRLITPAGVVSTLAGTGSAGHADGPAVAATFNAPMGVTVDGAGNVYVADTGNNTVRQITAGLVSTLAGTALTTGSVDGTGAKAAFSSPTGLAVTAAGIVYVADSGNQTIRAIKAGGIVSTLAGTVGTFGDNNALGKAATFYSPRGLALDASANLYVADSANNLVRFVTPAGIVSNFAGIAGAPGWAEGTGTAVRFNDPAGVTVSETGTIYVADATNNVIRMVTAGGVSSTLAGTAPVAGSSDGTGAAAGFNRPTDVALDNNGNLYVADSGNQTIRKIALIGGAETAVAGSGSAVTTLAGIAGTAGPSGSVGATGVQADQTTFNQPSALALDQFGNVYVADTGNGAIRVISAQGVVTTMATGFTSLQGIAVDAKGNVYAADAGTHAVYTLSAINPLTTLAGIPGTPGSNDGPAATATFNHPTRLTIDPATSILYVTDANNDTIRAISPAGVVSTVVGTVGTASLIPGNLPGALAEPAGIAVSPTTGLLLICVPDAIFAAQF